MAEPIITVGLGAIAAYIGKDGLEKLLGPTADYLGQGLRDFTARRADNIGRIFKSAQSKLGARMDSPGEVPPKVLRLVLDEGSFSSDALAVEYFGGILASSRTEQGRDDRGARMAKLLDGLSTYQLRAHYLIYSTIRMIFLGSDLNLNMEGRAATQIFIPLEGYVGGMDFNKAELGQFNQLVTHIFFGLSGDKLIDDDMRYGPPEGLRASFPEVVHAGIICGPSVAGTELFLWAFGHSDKPLEFLFDPTFSPRIEGVPNHFAASVATRKQTTSP